VTDPNITSLSRDWNEYGITNEEGDQIDIAEGEDIFLAPKNETSPEVVMIAITWDGFDETGRLFKLTLDMKVHREEPCAIPLFRWLEHYQTHAVYAEIASQLFTDPNEYCWKDQVDHEAVPPWESGQQGSFKVKPWTKENTAERQRTRPIPPPASWQDSLGPFSEIKRKSGVLGPIGRHWSGPG
jgi:hypothetical protein